MLQLDNLDAGDLLADEPAVPAPGVERRLPGQEDAVTQPVLQRFELGGELRMQERDDAVRLRVVERSVQQQVCVGAQSLMAALFPGDRIMSGEPGAEAAAGELVGIDDAALDDESRDGRIGCGAVRFERFDAGGVLRVSIAGALERVADSLSNPLDSTPRFQRSRPPRIAPGLGGFCALSRHFSDAQVCVGECF